MIRDITALAGGMNQFFFILSPKPLDAQTVVRMNRETLYGGAVVDTGGGATVTIPELPECRYASVLVVDNDRYAPVVIYDPGVRAIPTDTRFVMLELRIQVFDPDDPAEVTKVNAPQDQFVTTAASAEPVPPLIGDVTSLDTLREQYKSEDSTIRSANATMHDDGTLTAHVCSKALCGDVPNRLNTPESWSFIIRIDRRSPSVLDSTDVLPDVVPVK